MAKTITYDDELQKIREYLANPVSESGKRHLVYPLFQKMFPEKFKTESNAAGADIYIEGKMVIELKTNESDWLSGFYQALHYQKKGLAFPCVCVIAEKFLAVWKVNRIPEFAVIAAHTAKANMPPNQIGKENAKKTSKQMANEILESAIFCITPKKYEESKKQMRLLYEIYEFLNILKNLDADRLQINTFNFVETIEQMKKFFVEPIDAIHSFYSMVGFWDITSVIAENEFGNRMNLVGYKGKKQSENLTVPNKYRKDFIKFVEDRYVFTNEGSGLSVDYYFSRFDEVLTKLNPEYAKQHGVFFTDDNLGKFCLWYVEQELGESWAENYIILDPAAGSGNLVVSQRGKLKHKIVSDLQPDLLRTLERRMKSDPYHVETGFTIIPKIEENKGLNFLDKSAAEYLRTLENALQEKQLKLNKPLAFLLNPPYKNTDENEKLRTPNEAEYAVNPALLGITGEDAQKERYLAFLAQILLLCKEQVAKNIDLQPNFQPMILVFTPSSWLIPRPSYEHFRQIFDSFFTYQTGLMVTSNEFFKLHGRFPIAFTVWKFRTVAEINNLWDLEKLQNFWQAIESTNSNNSTKAIDIFTENYETRLQNYLQKDLHNLTENEKIVAENTFKKSYQNTINLHDFTDLKGRDLVIDWEHFDESQKAILFAYRKKANKRIFENNRGDIRTPLKQTMYDFKRDVTQAEKIANKLYGGLPKNDEKRKNKKTYGISDGKFVGFMDDNTPVRIKQDKHNRMSNEPNRVWFVLMTSFSKVNLSQIHSGAANSRSFCAYDLESAQTLFSWFAISKAVNNRYPVWANQYDLWEIDWKKTKNKDKKGLQKYFYSLCYAYCLAVNSCVVTKFEANNPVENTPEVFVDNPLCPTNGESFWAKILQKEIVSKENNIALKLLEAVTDLYKYWNFTYCKGQFMQFVGLQEEPYFKYFDYPDFLTPYSGLLQIRKYAENQTDTVLGEKFAAIDTLAEQVKEEIYNLLVEEIGYFD
jgi:hypothetical protein